MGKEKPRSPKSTPFATNGFAPTVTPKSNETKSKQHLQIIQKTLGKKK